MTKILEIEVFNITSPRYNKQIFPVPWHFVESRFQCMRLCTEAWVCSDLVPLASPPPSISTCYMYHHPSSLSLIICKCIHLHLRSLCIKADIKVQKRNNIVFCFSIDYTNSPFPHYCEHMHHLWAWVDNKKNENTEICKYQII